ncbi:hypothetical protein [Yersinia pekkanenii]|uniref:Uncharacterized protein n=1 Tax=Yersinia pekkanenii TaxID=1288385 RepID=A0A0T9NKS0_9GAMM|nr:hypothetical protein [Yersinia pekkanenii]CNH17268.1 Uncharacterised protein [Yersinia pekkanenii]CRY65706.1 Uncharacterised protein [Yersinia pekkanenii]
MKTKWFNANFQKSYDEIYNSIIKNPFKDDRGWGFSINHYESDALSAKYIERMEMKEIITDPFGNETLIEYFKFIQFNFWLKKESGSNYLLAIESAPRSIKRFIANMKNVVSSDFNVSNLNIIVEDFIKTVRENFIDVKVSKAKLKGLTFSKHTSGVLEIESSFDALDEIKVFFDKAYFTIEKATLLMGEFPHEEVIEVNTNGTVIFIEDSFRDMSKVIESINFNK